MGLAFFTLGAYRAGRIAITRATGVATQGVVTRTFVRNGPRTYSVLDIGGTECTVVGRVGEVGATVAVHHPVTAPSACVVDDPPRLDPSLALLLAGAFAIAVSALQARRARAIPLPLALPPDPPHR